MWSKTLAREVETVWPGIAEVQITAARTGLWMGMDPPKFGPEKTREFTGSAWSDNAHRMESYRVEVTYPEWVEFTVYRLVSGTRSPFTEVVFWEETYARVKKTEMPNEMWQKRPRGQLLKCGKAAALRAAFPEEAGEYTAEEMEGKAIEADGVPVHAPGTTIAAAAAMVAVAKPEGASNSAPAASTVELPKDSAPAEGGAPSEDPDRQVPLDDQIKAHVASLVKRAVASGAWGSADDYARSRFTGEHLTYALDALNKAAECAAANTEDEEAKAT
jgi:hypothetical protein